MLKRKAEEQFAFWKAHKTKQALLVTGARQVGKSYSIRKFAQDHYDTAAVIDFIENPSAARTLSEARDANVAHQGRCGNRRNLRHRTRIAPPRL